MYKRKYLNPESTSPQPVFKSGGAVDKAKDFVNNWNSQRSEQHRNNQLDVYGFPIPFEQNRLNHNVNTVKQDNSILPSIAQGVYNQGTHTVGVYGDDRSTAIHEVTHASNASIQKKKIKQLMKEYPFLKEGVHPDDYYDNESEIYSRLMEVRDMLRLDPKKHYSRKEIEKMIDSASEMIITVPTKDGKSQRTIVRTGDGRHIDSSGPGTNLDWGKATSQYITNDSKHFFERYSPLFIEKLINDVAATPKKKIPRASLGANTLDWMNIPEWMENNRNAFIYQKFNPDREEIAKQLRSNNFFSYTPATPSSAPAEEEVEETPTSTPLPYYALPVDGSTSNPQTGSTPQSAPQIKKGEHVFVDGVTLANIDQKIADFVSKAAEQGISFRITSTKRDGSGPSHHNTGNAIDITPVEGTTWRQLADQVLNNSELMQYLKDNGLNLVDETRPEILAKTKGTGAHWHIGPDSKFTQGWTELQDYYNNHRGVYAKKGIKIIPRKR